MERNSTINHRTSARDITTTPRKEQKSPTPTAHVRDSIYLQTLTPATVNICDQVYSSVGHDWNQSGYFDGNQSSTLITYWTPNQVKLLMSLFWNRSFKLREPATNYPAWQMAVTTSEWPAPTRNELVKERTSSALAKMSSGTFIRTQILWCSVLVHCNTPTRQIAVIASESLQIQKLWNKGPAVFSQITTPKGRYFDA